MTLFAFLTLGVLAGSAVAGAFEMHIPLPPRSAATQHEFLLITREIDYWNFRCHPERSRGSPWRYGRDCFTGSFGFAQDDRHTLVPPPNDRSHGDLNDFVDAGATAHFFSHPVPAIFRLDQWLVEKISEIIDVPVRAQDHVTATPAIAAVRPASRYKFFSSKTNGTAPAISCLRKNFYSINEHGQFKLPSPAGPVIPSAVEESRGYNEHRFHEILHSPQDDRSAAYRFFVFSAIAVQLKFSSTRLRPALPKRSR